METSEIGKKYGMLTIIEKTNKRQFTNTVYKYRCDCGNEVEVNINKLHTGHVKSCGCLRFKCKRYTSERFAEMIFHLHLCYHGDNSKLYFRDYLNDNPDVAKEYETLKLSL